MYSLPELCNAYLDYCSHQRRLDEKSVRAYRIDLDQFCQAHDGLSVLDITPTKIEQYVVGLHLKYKPKTVKRKIASLKAFYHYLDYRDVIETNPFHKLRLKFREPVILPKTIPLHCVESLLRTIYLQQTEAPTSYRRRNAVRDAAICELLFATGMRISELCSLHPTDIDLYDHCILIYGKGSRERRIQIGNTSVIDALKHYTSSFEDLIFSEKRLFVNQAGHDFTDQAVRRMINHYSRLSSLNLHITPHMFRHTFATALLEADVDIRYIQEILGHSSIHTTEIYTHVAMNKQRDILTTKHPRNKLHL